MQRIEFTMSLKPGCADEYKRRHECLWPELIALLKEAGVEHYTISLDEDSNTLYAGLSIANPAYLDTMGESELMRKWWAYMADIMITNPDQSPVIKTLKPMFYLP